MGRKAAQDPVDLAAGQYLPEGAKVTPMLRQWLEAKVRAPEAILLFRMGDFYELFAQDAVVAAPVLDLALTSRDKGKAKEDAVAMAGFPHHAAAQYIAKLIAAGHKVAVCDQLEDPALARGIVKRGVTRIVTPGVVLDGEGLSPDSANYLVGLAQGKDGLGLAALDVSTGVFFATCAKTREACLDEVRRLAPAEVVILGEHNLDDGLLHALATGPAAPARVERRPKKPRTLRDHKLAVDPALAGKDAAPARLAAELCLDYACDTQGGRPAHIGCPRPYSLEARTLIDPVTRQHLDLVGPRGERRRRGTLAASLDMTKTAAGARRLIEELTAPSADLAAIQARLDLVEHLVGAPDVRATVREALSQVYDVERVCARIAARAAGPRDLAHLRTSLSQLLPLADILAGQGDGFLARAERLAAVAPVAAHLEAALREELPAQLGAGPLFAAGFDADLDELLALKDGGQSAIFGMESDERARTGIPSLKVKYTRVFGYYIEVTKTHLDKIPDDYRRKQTVANAERFVTEPLKALEEKVAHAEARHKEREAGLFAALIDELQGHVATLLDAAEAAAEIDLVAGFAEVSAARRYVRPVLGPKEQRRLCLEQARHPVVEQALLDDGERYVPADLELSADERQLVIVTGPNMGGKSTLMRKVALCQVMAQVGCFVPAARAELSLVDRVFARVGASDNLAEGRSTFMVEMEETAHILRHASAHSLVILDEIGRGTATFDGLSIAWAVAEHVHDEVRARTLFATHYHELCELAAHRPRVKNIHVVVKEWNDEIIFTRTVKEGGAERSYGIQVARLAGLPAGLLARARELLAELEGDVVHPDADAAVPQRALKKRNKRDDQMNLFLGGAPEAKSPEQNLLDEMLDIDVNRLTPLQALNRLDGLVREARRLGKKTKDP